MKKKTVTRYIPQNGIYVYAREHAGKTELIFLNGTNEHKELPMHSYHAMLQGSQSGKEITSGKTIDLTKGMTLPPRQSLVIEL